MVSRFLMGFGGWWMVGRAGSLEAVRDKLPMIRILLSDFLLQRCFDDKGTIRSQKDSLSIHDRRRALCFNRCRASPSTLFEENQKVFPFILPKIFILGLRSSEV